MHGSPLRKAHTADVKSGYRPDGAEPPMHADGWLMRRYGLRRTTTVSRHPIRWRLEGSAFDRRWSY
ncbi:MAG: hypothetical protein MI924_09035 [Chloroflexales bacterium]|nr:hypothetical protein [Chloroflexales bacterium]